MDPLVLPLLMYKEKGSTKKGTKKKTYVVPSWNHLYVIRNNRPILDQWAMKHRDILAFETSKWAASHNWACTSRQKVFVRVRVYWNDAREKDCHNLDKLLLDAFENIIYENDSYALLQYIDFDIDVKNPRMEVTFELGESFDRKEKAKSQK